MEKVVIKSEDAFSIIRVINKMGIKKDLIDLVKNSMKLNNRKTNVFKELYIREGLTQEDEINGDTIFKHSDLSKELNDINEELSTYGMDIIYSIIANIPLAEKEVYVVLSKVYGVKEKDIKELEFDGLVEKIMGVVKSESFQRFFTLIMK